ncbi:SDR family NAD(P)-dependent oxidoreductase [Sphingomonas oryzagri]|uniref:SDR family oxidoreductase n=1 Tax=Sphingomonas oryzagri TaxID=3042314 RepID=A0ABT6N1V5_9SPHN|nr:glucose 1-dehydrogenase [Sphingomonas oryzagri]MDH7639041.1 SDR family oxidoreductase [Sphingomonas oryzagri]
MGILSGKSIIVTGAGGGIGRASCLVLAAAGARLVVSDVAEAAGRETTEEVNAQGGEAIFVAADLASEEAIAGLVTETIETYGRLDGAFNNAGVEQRNKPLADLTLAEWSHAIDIDLTAVFLCVKHQVKAMLETGGGSIVNTASSLGQVGLAGASEYCAAKHGVIGLTRAAGADYGPHGIRVNAVLPGITRTPMIARLSEAPQLSAVFDRLRSRHSMGRFGEPSEIGESVKWLLSDDASFMNGAAVACDGGYLSI